VCRTFQISYIHSRICMSGVRFLNLSNVVNCRLLTAESQVQSEGTPCGIRNWQSMTGYFGSKVPIIIQLMFQALIIQGWYNGLTWGASTKGLIRRQSNNKKGTNLFCCLFVGAVKRFNNEYISFTVSICPFVRIQLSISTTDFDEI
jgi:hypothetical protein